jgi:DNA-binding LacI/PurR family transcriptional regulator
VIGLNLKTEKQNRVIILIFFFFFKVFSGIEKVADEKGTMLLCVFLMNRWIRKRIPEMLSNGTIDGLLSVSEAQNWLNTIIFSDY